MLQSTDLKTLWQMNDVSCWKESPETRAWSILNSMPTGNNLREFNYGDRNRWTPLQLPQSTTVRYSASCSTPQSERRIRIPNPAFRISDAWLLENTPSILGEDRNCNCRSNELEQFADSAGGTGWVPVPGVTGTLPTRYGFNRVSLSLFKHSSTVISESYP